MNKLMGKTKKELVAIIEKADIKVDEERQSLTSTIEEHEANAMEAIKKIVMDTETETGRCMEWIPYHHHNISREKVEQTLDDDRLLKTTVENMVTKAQSNVYHFKTCDHFISWVNERITRHWVC